MSNRVKPTNRRVASQGDMILEESEDSLAVQRNERLAKKGERQMNYERRNRDPEGMRDRRGQRRRSAPEYQEEEDEKPKYDEQADVSPSVDEFKSFRYDAVVFIVFLAQIIGCVAIGFELYAYCLDQDWNKMASGQMPLNELEGHKSFEGKTFKLSGHLYLEKALEYCTRNEPQEIMFVVIIICFIVVTFVQLCACYIKTADVERNAITLIGLYAFAGASCIFIATFPVSGAINIENSYTYAAEMLHNFRYLDDDIPLTDKQQDLCQGEYKNGCDYFEYGKLQAKILEDIFRMCGAGSRFTRYYQTEAEDPTTIEVMGETYTRSELKEIGFCSRDGYKYSASACAIIMGVLCSFVPIIFCCQGRTQKQDGYVDETESTQTIVVKPKESPPEPAEPEEPQKRKRSSGFDRKAAIEQFREYVERDTD